MGRSDLAEKEEEMWLESPFGRIYGLLNKGEKGSDQCVIFLHGLGSTRDALCFEDVAKRVACATFRFDFPGHGQSTGRPQYLYEEQAETARWVRAELEKTLGIAKFTFVGHSKGATIAEMVAEP